MTNPPHIIVLAAGEGRRFQGSSHKLLAPMAGGHAVLSRTLALALASGLPVLVVARPELAALARRQMASRDVLEITAAQAARGMGSSIAAGVGARADAGGWLILPGDMPMVQPATLQAVAAALPEHAVVFPQYRGRRGHPVGFAPELCSELLALQGDEGARRIVSRYPVHAVEVPDLGVLVDVDTQSDLQRLNESLEPSPPAAG